MKEGWKGARDELGSHGGVLGEGDGGLGRKDQV